MVGSSTKRSVGGNPQAASGPWSLLEPLHRAHISSGSSMPLFTAERRADQWVRTPRPGGWSTKGLPSLSGRQNASWFCPNWGRGAATGGDDFDNCANILLRHISPQGSAKRCGDVIDVGPPRGRLDLGRRRQPVGWRKATCAPTRYWGSRASLRSALLTMGGQGRPGVRP